MPTKKQRKRLEKGRRHEYETVWVDSEGNELEEPPDDTPAPTRERRSDGKKTPEKRPRQGRATRVPPQPSWRRAIRRGALLGVVIVLFFYIAGTRTSGASRIVAALVWGVGYGALLIPFTYYLDRFLYRRWQRNQPPAKKR